MKKTINGMALIAVIGIAAYPFYKQQAPQNDLFLSPAEKQILRDAPGPVEPTALSFDGGQSRKLNIHELVDGDSGQKPAGIKPSVVLDQGAQGTSPVQASGATPPQEGGSHPVYKLSVHIDGIMKRGSSDSIIKDSVQMLKDADQTINDVQFLAKNGYGDVLEAVVVHTPGFPVNEEVLKQASATSVEIDGIFGGNSYDRIKDTINVLKSAEQKIINVEATDYNGYGKILAAKITHISRYKYDAIMQKASAGN